MYQAVKDFVIIEADKNKNFVRPSGIIVDTRWSPVETEYVCQDGIVKSIPAKITGNPEVEIKEGDRVFCHHFLTDISNEVEIDGKIYYRISYHDIYCKVDPDGTIHMINNWNFCDPLYGMDDNFVYEKDEYTGVVAQKTKSGIYMATDVKSDTKRNRLRFMCKGAKDMGLEPGMTMVYREDCDYEIKVDGRIYHRVRTEDFLAYETVQKEESVCG